ncbi:MAG: histidinol phosphate phosphatase domain-containing protein [Candidatus Firestonebacteria bacterium]|nr:histidinol phosphate phosphatase domain-containing protein [Candidatus Firestonebacteria bacterium]
MIDFHTHTLFSDGELLPSELVQRAKIIGYETIGITDHVDESNLEQVIKGIIKVTEEINKLGEIFVIPGIEITHVPPPHIPCLVEKARKEGAKLIIVHGQTISEPVANGTNLAALKSDIDILAHPGIINSQEVELAKKNNIYLEITSRRGHAYTNGHVLRLALEAGAKLIINSDSHAPFDLLTEEWVEKIALGAGMTKEQFLSTKHNALELSEKIKKRY